MKSGVNDTSLARRRILSVALGVLAYPIIARPAQATGRSIFEWTGTALGAPARILIADEGRKAAQSAVHRAVMELERIEDQFSLYRDTSALSRLNRDGLLVEPSMDMRQLIEMSRHMGMLSDGAFDVSVQPLWRFLADHFARDPATSHGPDPQALSDIRRLVDYRQIKLSDRRITLAQGMSLTLNGIAQGYATDRVVNVLRTSGYHDALVELGEAYGAGERSPWTPWQIGIGESYPDRLVPLAGRALAVSSSDSTLFTQASGYSHILNPRSGSSAQRGRVVYVIHSSATVADALSTALCVMPPEQAKRLIARCPGTDAFEISANGVHKRLG